MNPAQMEKVTEDGAQDLHEKGRRRATDLDRSVTRLAWMLVLLGFFFGIGLVGSFYFVVGVVAMVEAGFKWL